MKVINISLFKKFFYNKQGIMPKHISQTMECTDKPIIANLKSWYKDAGEKLNDIFLEQTINKTSTYVSKYNKDAYERLPQVIKDAIKPSDVSYNGHINQDKINELWEAAKKAHKPGVHGIAPVFRGGTDNPQEFLPSYFDTHMPIVGIEKPDIDLVSYVDTAPEHLVPGGEEIVGDIVDHIQEQGDNIIEHLLDLIG